MDTNNDFDSKKIIEEIENLENDTSSKKKKKFGLVNFIETAILVVLIFYIIMTVGSQFMKDIFSYDEYDYEYDDYYYEDYDEYDDNYDYSAEEDYYTSPDDSLNMISNTLTIDEFMNSNFGNMIITENVQESTSNTVSTNIINIENASVESSTLEENIYDEEEILKQEFEVEKKNLKIAEEGKNVNGDLLISLENENSKLVHNFDVYTVFYKADKIIKVDSQMVECILKNNKKFLKIDETPKDYDRYEVFVDKDIFYEFTDELLHENLKYDSYIEDDVLEVQLSNIGKKIDRACFTIVYLDKNKNILDIENTTEFDIGKYLGGSIRGYGVWDEINRRYVEYDSYEIILDYAGNYDN